MFNTQLTIDELDYVLPHELIAQTPASERGGSRLLVTGAGEFEPRLVGRFDEVVLDQLQADDLVIANDSRVMRARVPITRDTGGGGELLLLEPVASMATATTSIWRAMARPARKLRPGSTVATTLGGASIRCIERESAQLWLVELPAAVDDVPAWLQAHGELPLPPYITERQADDERYQTVHAAHEGSVAAPTAGLHFDDAMWNRIRERCEVAHVTLHVGAGTFLPISSDSLAEHVMHYERFEISAVVDARIRAAIRDGRRIVAVGTTTTRTLETVYAVDSHASAGAQHGSTDLFITPGHQWACVGALITNFHLPKSTLVALVMSFHGIDTTRAIYEAAINARMRFYSFGDAMFIHGPAVAQQPTSGPTHAVIT